MIIDPLYAHVSMLGKILPTNGPFCQKHAGWLFFVASHMCTFGLRSQSVSRTRSYSYFDSNPRVSFTQERVVPAQILHGAGSQQHGHVLFDSGSDLQHVLGGSSAVLSAQIQVLERLAGV